MSDTVRLIRSDRLSDVAEYAYAATPEPGTRLVFLAGACPLDGEGGVVAPGDHAEQARQVMDNLESALDSAGATLSDVVQTRVLVASTERADLVTAWQVVRDRFGEHDAPSTLLGVTVLGYPDQLVEVEAIAAVRVA